MKRYLLTLLVVLVLVISVQAQEKIYLPLVLKEDSCMGIAKLAISDGTTEISLLDLEGIHLAEDDGWTPKIIQAKSGGVFQDSSMAAGRRLVYRQFGTAREDFTFNIMGISQDDLIAETSDLLQMLEKAVNYWATDWQSDIVYLIAQSDCETYARYAPILYYEAPELQNPYAQPFVQAGDGAIFDDIGIMIERGHWQSTIPGNSDCTKNNSIQEWGYDSFWEVISALPAGPVVSFTQTTTGRIFAGESGQILYSDDDGLNWAVSTVLPVSSVTSLIQTNSGRILAGEVGQIWYSDNNGAAWAVLSATPISSVLDIIQLKSGRLIASDDARIWYSDDDGANWNLAYTGNGIIKDLLQTTTGRILAGDVGGILYSDDNGITWNKTIIGYATLTGFFGQTSSGNILATSGGNDLYVSEDNAGSFYKLYTFTNSPNYILQTSTDRIYISVGFDIYVSRNDGIYWKLDTTIPTAPTEFFETTTGRILAGDDGQILDYYDVKIDMGASDELCDSISYLSNKQNIANITTIFIDDGGVFSSNLLPMTLPATLLPAVPVVNDAIYFGSNTSVDETGPFSSLVFDLSTGAISTSSYTILWEYWDGAAWSTLTTTDGTNNGLGALSNTNVNSIHWTPPSNWATTAVNGITGYWVRARLSALAGTLTPPVQQNRNIYTVVNGYIEIDNVDVLGDIPALSQLKLRNRSDKDGPAGSSPNLYENRLLVGLRSYDRGNNFQPYINISDEQNPFAIAISVGTNTTIGTDIAAPTGRSATYNPGGVEAMATRATVTLSTTIARDFYGSYHAFLRVQRTAGASTDFDVQLVFVTGSGGIQKTTESKQVQTTTAFELLDFGQVTIPVGGSLASSDLGDQIQILIQASAASGVPNLVLYDLILIPVDEWAIDSVDQTNSSTSDIGRSGDISKLLDIDSMTDPKNPIKSIVRQVGSDFVTANYNPITNGPAILQSNVDQRLWFLAAKTSATGSSFTWISPPEIVHSVQLFKAQRYLGLRGNR